MKRDQEVKRLGLEERMNFAPGFLHGFPMQNQALIGVSRTSQGLWRAIIWFQGKEEMIGVFNTALEAAWEREKRLSPKHSNFGPTITNSMVERWVTYLYVLLFLKIDFHLRRKEIGMVFE